MRNTRKNCKYCSANLKFKYNLKDYKLRSTSKEFKSYLCSQCNLFYIYEDDCLVDGSKYYGSSYAAYQNTTIKANALQDHYTKGSIAVGRLAWHELIDWTTIKSTLDIGCGSGKHIALLKSDYRCHFSGIDTSQDAVLVARKNGLDVRKLSVEELTDLESHDLIVMSHIIEHLSDPKVVLEYLFSNMANGSRLIIATPNTNCLERILFGKYWDGWDTPRHIVMFNADTLTNILRQIGFNNIHILYEEYSIFTRSLRNLLSISNDSTLLKVVSRLDVLFAKILPRFKISGAMQIVCSK